MHLQRSRHGVDERGHANHTQRHSLSHQTDNDQQHGPGKRNDCFFFSRIEEQKLIFLHLDRTKNYVLFIEKTN